MTTDRVDQLFDEATTGIVADQAADGGPLTVPIKGACLLLGYSLSHLRRLISAGKLESPVPGQITAQSIAAMVRERMAKNRYNAARTQLMAERSKIAAIKRKAMESELVEAAMAAEAFASVVEVVRQRILAIPAEVAPALAAATDAGAVSAIMAEAIDCALNELAATPVEGPGKAT